MWFCHILPLHHGKGMALRGAAPLSLGLQVKEMHGASQHTADAVSHEQEINFRALSSHHNLLIEFENQKTNWQAPHH